MIVQNPKDGADIKDVYKQVVYEHPKGRDCLYKDDEVAKYLLKKYEFLKELYVKEKDVETYPEPVHYDWIDFHDLKTIDRNRKPEKAIQDNETVGPDWVGEGLQEEGYA